MTERGQYAYFSEEEYNQRQQKAFALMEKDGLDALFLLQSENILYFTGYTSWLKTSKHRPFVCLLVKGHDPILILPLLQSGDAEAFSFVEDIRLWSANYLDLYVSTIKDLGLDDKRIGVEVGEDTHLAMPYIEFERMKAMLPDVDWVDCSRLVFECRKIKSPQEIVYMRKASEIADKAIENACNNMHAGMLEREICEIVGKTFAEEGAEEIGFVIVRSAPSHSHEEGFLCNKVATDREIRSGDIIGFDIGCVYRGYCSDMMRAASIGEPDPQVVKGYAATMKINRAVREGVRPGITADELDKIREKAFKETQYEPWLPFTGHAIGSTAHELPRIGPGVEEVLQPGLTFAIEPTVKVPPYIFIIEDVMLVTEDGGESLNKVPRDLYIVE
ncbi:MAG: Xaa-Pro peptidase family protein [Anaerolineales bacterium]